LTFKTDLDTVVDTTHWICTDWVGDQCWDSISCNPDSTTCDFSYIDTLQVFVGNLDTVGSRMGGWDRFETRSLNGQGTDLKVTAWADTSAGPFGNPGIPPGQGLLFRILGDIESVPDTLQDRTVWIYPQLVKDHFSFSRSDGSSIGVTTMEVPDSNFYRCNSWVPPDSEVCLVWERVQAGQPWDSVDVEIDTVGILSEDSIVIINGKLTVDEAEPWICGDVDGSGTVNIGDLSAMIGFLYINGTPPDPIQIANTSCTAPVDQINIGDVSALISKLYVQIGPLCCDDSGY
jgi:hypothetical protein